MSSFKSNLNMFLTTLLIIVLVGLVILTIYFQTSLNRFNQRYNEKDDEVDKLRLELLQYQESTERLNQTVNLLNVDLIEYTQEFELTYEQLSHERNQLFINLNNTQNQLRLKEIELQNKINELRNLKNNFNILSLNITKIEEEIKFSLNDASRIEDDSQRLYNFINNNYFPEMSIEECLNVLSRAKDDSDNLETRTRANTNQIKKIDDMIKSIINRIEQIKVLLVGY